MKIINFLKKRKYHFLLFFVTILFFNKLFFNPSAMLLPGDTLGSAYFPKYFFSSFIKLYKEIPLWNPYMFSGMPFQADPSSSMFYPLNLLFLIIPTGYSFGYLYFLDIFLIGLFTYLFAKSINLDNFSSFISGLIFMFSGEIVFRIYAGHLYILDAIVWLPIFLTLLEMLLKTKKSIFAVFGAIPIALMIFAGHSQFTFYNILFSSFYFFLRLLFLYKKNKNILEIFNLILNFFFLIFVGIFLSAIQLFPSLELSRLSERSSGISFEFAKAFSLHPYQLLSFIFPYFFGSPFNNTFWGKGNFWETCAYLGIIPLFLALFSILHNKNKYVFIFFSSAIIAIILSFGGYTPVYELFFKSFPFFNLFRAPARFLYLYSFSISILSGFGINYILNNKFNRVKIVRLKTLSLTLISVSFFTILFSLILNSSKNINFYEKFILRNNSLAIGINHFVVLKQFSSDIFNFSILIMSFFILLYLFLKSKVSKNVFKIVASLIIFIDLWTFGSRVIDVSKANQQYVVPSVINKILQDKSTYRVFSQTGEYSNISIVNNIQILTGYNGEYLKNYRDFLWLTGKYENTPFESFIIINSIDNLGPLNLLNTKYVIWNKKITVKNLKYINEYSENNIKSYLYENTSFLPRAYVVSDKALKENKFIISKKIDKLPNFAKLDSPIFLNLDKTYILENAKIANYSPNKIEINVNMEKSGYLVLSEIYYPGWKAYDNNKETEVLKGDYIFRTIFLSKGHHNIKFIFNPESFKIGKLISLSTLFFILVSLILFLKPKASYKRILKLLHQL
ncbi:MAG TPA: YfhO family protein [Candidatus Sulfotelmatobacter sp.]|nr:YfhO family protein [Candidatus Sulfotelmatobacter sp.]